MVGQPERDFLHWCASRHIQYAQFMDEVHKVIMGVLKDECQRRQREAEAEKLTTGKDPMKFAKAQCKLPRAVEMPDEAVEIPM